MQWVPRSVCWCESGISVSKCLTGIAFHYAHLTGEEAKKTQRQEREKRKVSERQEGQKGQKQRR